MAQVVATLLSMQSEASRATVLSTAEEEPSGTKFPIASYRRISAKLSCWTTAASLGATTTWHVPAMKTCCLLKLA